MNKIIFKSVLMIALVCLSFGAFAQFSTTIFFNLDALPQRPADKLNDVNIVVTYYLENGQVYAIATKDHQDVPPQSGIDFPGDLNALLSIAYTKIALYFYGGYCGTGQTFIAVPLYITCPLHFGDWWYALSPRQVDPK